MTTITRDDLLASVYELKPGDLLILRVPDTTTAHNVDFLSGIVADRLAGTGIRHLVITGQITVEAWRAAQTSELSAGVVPPEDRPDQPTPADPSTSTEALP